MTLEEMVEQHDDVIGGNRVLLIRRKEIYNEKPINYLAYLYRTSDNSIRLKNEFEQDTIIYPKINTWEAIKLTSIYDIVNRIHPIEFGE